VSRILLQGDSVRNPNLYYRTHFLIGDPILYFADGKREVLVVSGFEKTRAQKQSRVHDVFTMDELGYRDALAESGDEAAAQAAVILNLVGDANEAIEVEGSFPVYLADAVRATGLEIRPNVDLIREERRSKTADEVEYIARAQSRAERAISQAVEILTESVILENSIVYRGIPLTVERLRGELDASFAKDDFVADGMIIAPGPGGADPHWTGTGALKPNETIIFDVFPQDRRSRYYGDVTRTYVKGTPSDALLDMHETVLKAQLAALDMIGPGVDGAAVHAQVMGIFADAGYGEGGPHSARCLHGTGHGVGLEIHEAPRLGRTGDVLQPGDVVTVEPGLYEPSLGGIRIEDTVVVTGSGCRNLNKLAKDLVIS
jgi:Xaa-Pro aminopeptidase